MSLVWHIVRKDFRRLAGPLGLWLVLVLAHVSLLFVWEGQVDTNPAAIEGKRYFVNTCGVIVLGVGFILAAWLVMEDSQVGTGAFWRTRPISGLRLLVAKALGAFLMLSLLPALVVLPVWLWCGFSPHEIASAAIEMGAVQALCSLMAFALSSITETSGQFLIRLLGGAIVLPLYAAFAGGMLTPAAMPRANLASEVSTQVMLLFMPLIMALHQFLTRRTGRTWFIMMVCLGLLWVPTRWIPGLSALLSGPDLSAESLPVAAGPVFTAERFTARTLQSLNSMAPVSLEGRVTGLPAGGHVRVDSVHGRWVGPASPQSGPRFLGAVSNAQPQASAVRQLAGLPGESEGTAAWSASGSTSMDFLQKAVSAPFKLNGVVRATLLQGRVLGEIPLRPGAMLRSGSSLTRIKSINWVDDNLVVLLEERDAWVLSDSGNYRHSQTPAYHRIRPAADGFVVLNRARGFDQLPQVNEIGTIKADSIVVGRRNLVLSPPAQDDAWLEGAVLVKVRFFPGGKITQPLSGADVELSY